MINRRYLESIRRRKRMFRMFVIFLLIVSFSIILMPIGSLNNGRYIMYLAGAAFWIGFIGAVCMAVKINNSRKSNYQFNEKYGGVKQLGLIHFFQNKDAVFIDVIMLVAVTGLVLAKLFVNYLIVIFIFLAIFVFAFGMHCMLNGINYKYITHIVRRDEES